MNTDTLFSSSKHDWGTPRTLFAAIEQRVGPFDLDAAASAENTLCDRWLGPGSAHEDALTCDWIAQRVWLNPPYGKALPLFVRKACIEVLRSPGMEVWMLVPARPDTQWWAQLIRHATQVIFLKGRVRFEGAPSSAPFPSAVVCLRSGGPPSPSVEWGWAP